jgi:1-deoxy-D-xylulose-5-phosphate reductoisomerase
MVPHAGQLRVEREGEPSGAPRRITLLGATGSIGASTIAVVRERPADFAIETVTANRDGVRLAALARSVGAKRAVLADEAGYAALKAELTGTDIAPAAGAAALAEAAAAESDIVVAAIVGAAGLAPTLAAVEAGRTVALANKECLVCAGPLFSAAVERHGVQILPVDSEHNAIFQALELRNLAEVERIILTASGGPFRTWTRTEMATATAADALKHPNWRMGQKVTIDSATLMNKGLEVIEAHHLFKLSSDRIEVLVHPQSAVHGVVAYSDGSMLAQLGPRDMRVPIAYCLSWPDRRATSLPRLDLVELAQLTFERPDTARFPALALAYAALEKGSAATNMLNAANEIAVAAFLRGEIGFLAIAELAGNVLEYATKNGVVGEPASIAEALEIDAEARRIAEALIDGLG